jgi:signal transduction histidine kinase
VRFGSRPQGALPVALNEGAKDITFSPAVLLATWLGGLVPGLVATAVCALGASGWLPPAGSLVFADAHDRVALVLLVAVGVMTSGIVGRLHFLLLRQVSDRAALAIERALLMEREREARAAADAASRAKDQSLAILGHEIRNPLAAISTASGLLFSQMLTLYTTPVVYLYLDRFRLWWERLRRGRRPTAEATGGTA